MLYTWPAVYIVSLVIITRPAVHTATWQLIKDAFNSPLLSLTNPNTNPYSNPNPNPAHTAHIVSIWNSLPNSVVDVDSVCLFKARLDKFWMHQDVL